MAALASFSFRGYSMRPAHDPACKLICLRPEQRKGVKKCQLCDMRLAEAWTAADSHHRDTTLPIFWLDQRLGTESYVMEDSAGPILFFKMVRQPGQTVEMHVQFPPLPESATGRAESRYRVVHALMLGFEWLERVLILREIKSLSFICDTPQLKRFCEKRLGFTQDHGTRLRKVIARPPCNGNLGEES